MALKISPKTLSDYCRALAQGRWRKARPEERSRAAQHASIARWQKFRAWKESHAEEAAAADAIARAARAVRRGVELTDDERLERLERRLSQAQAANAALLPWGDSFRRRARRLKILPGSNTPPPLDRA